MTACPNTRGEEGEVLPKVTSEHHLLLSLCLFGEEALAVLSLLDVTKYYYALVLRCVTGKLIYHNVSTVARI